MENQKTYLNYLPQIFYFALFIFLYNILTSYWGWNTPGPDGKVGMEYIISQGVITGLQHAVMWFFIAKSFGQSKAAMIAFFVHFVISSASVYYFFTNPGTPSLAAFALNTIVMLPLPFLIYGLLSYKNSKAFLFMIMGVLLLGISVANYGYSYFQIITRWLGMLDLDGYYQSLTNITIQLTENSYRSISIFQTLSYSVPFIFVYILFSELILFIERKDGENTFLKINLTTTYTKLSASVIFYSLRLLYFSLSFGILAKVLRDFMNNNNNNSLITYIYLVFGLFTWFVLLWYLRKFLLEFFLSQGWSISWKYWSLYLPLVGGIIWLINIFKMKTALPEENRISLFERMKKNKNDGLKTLIVLLQVIFLAISVGNSYGDPSMIVIIPGIISIALIIIYFQAPQMLYGILGFSILGFLIIMMAGAYKNPVIGPTFFLTLGQLFLLYPLFHLDQFGLVVSAETAIEGEGETG